MAFRAYLGQGIKYPFEVDTFGKITVQSDADLIKQSLRILFDEPVGTELFREHYGSQIRLCMFEPMDAILTSLLDYYIFDAISKWERRISLYDIKYRSVDEKSNVIMCTVYYQIKKASEIDSFIFPFYRELKN